MCEADRGVLSIFPLGAAPTVENLLFRILGCSFHNGGDNLSFQCHRSDKTMDTRLSIESMIAVPDLVKDFVASGAAEVIKF